MLQSFKCRPSLSPRTLTTVPTPAASHLTRRKAAWRATQTLEQAAGSVSPPHHRRATSEALELGRSRDDFRCMLFPLLLATTCRSLVWPCPVDLRRETPVNLSSELLSSRACRQGAACLKRLPQTLNFSHVLTMALASVVMDEHLRKFGFVFPEKSRCGLSHKVVSHGEITDNRHLSSNSGKSSHEVSFSIRRYNS